MGFVSVLPSFFFVFVWLLLFYLWCCFVVVVVACLVVTSFVVVCCVLLLLLLLLLFFFHFSFTSFFSLYSASFASTSTKQMKKVKRESNKKSKKKRWSNGDQAEKQNRETKKGRTQTNHRTRKLEQRSSMVGLTQTKQNINFSSFVVFLILFLPSFFIPYLYFHFFPLFCFKVKEAKLFVFCCLAFVVWAMSKGKKTKPLVL